jgi:hypothetical protein
MSSRVRPELQVRPQEFCSRAALGTQVEADQARMYHGTLIRTMLRLPLTNKNAFSNSAR